MSIPVRTIAYVGVPFVAWLVFGMPSASEISSVWVAALAFALFWSMRVFQGAFLRLVGVDMDIYDNVVPWILDGFNLLAAVIALALFGLGHFGGENIRGILSSSVVGGIVLFVAMVLLLAPALFARRTLGARGEKAIVDPRRAMRSAAQPARSMAEFEASARDADAKE